MPLSKPMVLVYDLVGSYFYQLHYNPIRTKSITSCLIATLGNLASQVLSGAKTIDQDSLIAFGIFGLFFGGTIPHYFYHILDIIVPDDVVRSSFKRLLVERLIFTPLFQGFSLYMLARLEGKSHQQAVEILQRIYWPILKANWKLWTVLQYINVNFVPSLLRVLVGNILGFFWVIYVARKRSQRAPQGRRE